MEKRRKYLWIVTLKTEYTVLLCADVKRIAINGKRGCGMWQFWRNLFPCACLVIYLIDATLSHTP